MKILVIDDEKNVRRIIGDYLRNEGFEVLQGADGEDGLEKLAAHTDIALILLDIRMPGMDGYETIREIRKITDTPVIFLTALDEPYNEVKGLELGADDYVTKPFEYQVLVARVKACIRKDRQSIPDKLVLHDLTVDFSNHKAAIHGEDCGLTNKEFLLLETLMKNKNLTMGRSKLLDRVWGYDYYGDPRTVDTHVKTLRAKLGKYGTAVQTVRGVGYRFALLEDQNDPQ